MSFAAFTRPLAWRVSKCCSSSPIEGIHVSETSVSRIVAISDGGRHMSAIKLDKGLSIF